MTLTLLTLMFTVVSWLYVPLIEQVTGPRATTVNNALTVAQVQVQVNVLLNNCKQNMTAGQYLPI